MSGASDQPYTLSYHSTQGLRRVKNKDLVFSVATNRYLLAGVLDGVSSATGAERAVQLAGDYLHSQHEPWLGKNHGLAGLVLSASREMQKAGPEPFATIALVYIRFEEPKAVSVLGVGDSRVYGISSQAFEQLTVDHVNQGYSESLNRYLGTPELFVDDDDIRRVGFRYDRYLICTDGLYRSFADSSADLLRVHAALSRRSLRSASTFLKGNYMKSNSDDASFILVDLNHV